MEWKPEKDTSWLSGTHNPEERQIIIMHPEKKLDQCSCKVHGTSEQGVIHLPAWLGKNSRRSRICHYTIDGGIELIPTVYSNLSSDSTKEERDTRWIKHEYFLKAQNKGWRLLIHP